MGINEKRITTLTTKAKDIIAMVLREFFAENNGLIPIVRYAYAMETATYPCIIITVSSGSYKPLGIGMGFAQDIRNACGKTIAERRGFMVKASVQLRIMAQSSEERQRLLDQTLTAMLIIEMQNLYDLGITILSADFGNEETVPLGDAINAYAVTISLNILTEVYYDELVQYIRSIGVTTHNGETVAEWPDLNCEP